MGTPGGYTALNAPAGTGHGSWSSPSAAAAGVTAALGTSTTWGALEIEISHA
jgi:hypothetical protein